MQAFQQFYHLLLCLKICWLVFYKQLTFVVTKKQASTKILKSFYSKYFSDIKTLIFFTRVKTRDTHIKDRRPSMTACPAFWAMGTKEFK
jgi:hypothetical protein